MSIWSLEPGVEQAWGWRCESHDTPWERGGFATEDTAQRDYDRHMGETHGQPQEKRVTEQRYTLEEAQAELARRTCHVTGHQVAAITYGSLDGEGPVTYHCGRCASEYMMAVPLVAEGPFTMRFPLGGDDEGYRYVVRQFARGSDMEIVGDVKFSNIDMPGTAAGYRRVDVTFVRRDRKMTPAPTDDSWIKMDRLERPTK